MKFIRIFLLVLIIIGIGALITHKTWVPKLTDYIISSENYSMEVIQMPIQNTDSSVSIKDGRHCYIYNQTATDTAPYEVKELIDITIASTNVSGTKSGTQSGPDMTNGYNGTLEGTLEKDTITALYSYTVEASDNKEKEIYKINNAGMQKWRYPLKDERGILVPDTTKEYKVLFYLPTDCNTSI